MTGRMEARGAIRGPLALGLADSMAERRGSRAPPKESVAMPAYVIFIKNKTHDADELKLYSQKAIAANGARMPS